MITVKLEIGNKNKFREKVYRTCGLHSTLNRLILVLLSIINVHHVTNFERSLFSFQKFDKTWGILELSAIKV